MATRAQEIRVGVFVVVAAALVGIVLVVFGGMQFWRARTTYFVVIDDTAYGLEEGALVYFGGIPIGKVTDLELVHDDPGQLVVRIEVDRDVAIHADTRAVLQYAGLTGLKEIDLRGGSRAAPVLLPGGMIPQGESALDEVQRHALAIAERSEALLERSTELVDNLVAITQPAEYEGVLRDARTAAENLAAATAAIRDVVGENRAAIRSAVAAVGGAARSTHELLDRKLAAVLDEAQRALADVRSITRGNRGSLQGTLADLRDASRSLRELARELRQQPSRLLYGKPPPERKLP